MIGMFWSMLQSENENISFLYSVLIEKKRLFQKYKAMDIFSLLQKCIEKAQKKETEKNDDSGVGFCNRGGQKEKKILSNWGIFLLFLLHTYTVITV